MPIASPEVYAEMLDRARQKGFAYPAINVTSSQTLNAALQGFSEAGSDGIIQISTGGAEYASGQKVKDMVTGAVALAEYARVVAKNYPVNIALHTDHCQKEKLDTYVNPLIAISQQRVDKGQDPLFNSHMWDGSAIEVEENLQIAEELLSRTAKAKIILEIEVGAVGGEEDGVTGEINEKLYTTVADGMRTLEVLGLGKDKPFDLVFHGGSGSTAQEIADAVSYGVVKMNVDTDTQYAFSRPVVDHVMTNYSGMLKIDGEVGNKKMYDPRSWGRKAETGMAARVVEACERLGSEGNAMNA